MYNHRRGRSSSRRPTQPTSAALIAATAVYRPNTSSLDPHLAAAAAGAALRHVTVTPTPPGTIQTKRMLQRRGSYSSVTPPSDSENGPRWVQRSHSTSSLTRRRFRKPKLPPPTSPPAQQQYHQHSGATGTHPRNGKARGYFPSSSSDDGDSEEDSNIWRSASIRSTSSNLSFPSTLRGPTMSGQKRSKSKRAPPARSMLSRGSLRDSKPVPPSYFEGFRRRSPEPDLTAQTRRKNQQANENVCQAEYAESVCSATGSELGSIAEEDGGGAAGRIIRNNAPPRIAEESSEGQDETFNSRRPNNKVHEASSVPRAATHTTSASPTRKRNSQSRRRERSLSPSRTHFSLNTTEDTPTKHSPPPRSVSPAKSALKHHPASPPPVPPVPANTHLNNPPSSPSGRKTRVSFSDEDSVASFIHSRAPISTDSTPPIPPVFGSIRRTGRGAPQNGNAKNTRNKSLPPAIYSISPPPSSSSQEDLRLEQHRADTAGPPDGRLGYTPPETNPSSSVLGRSVPELVVVIPTPLEKGENEAMGSAAQALDGFPAGESSSANAAAPAREDIDSDSDGASIYSDAYDDCSCKGAPVPSIMQVAGSQEAPSPLPHVPRTQPQPGTINPPDPQNDTQTTNPPDPQNGTQTSQKNPTKSHKRESPPLPPDFIPGYTSTISPSSSCRPQSPIRTHSTSPSSSDTASMTSISSFKRVHPRQPRTGMRSTMRSDPPPSAPRDPHQKPAPLRKQKRKQMKSTLRGTSRIPDSSNEDEEYRRPALQSCFAGSDDEDFAIGPGAGGKGKLRRKRPNRGAFPKKEKDNVGKVKNGFWARFGKSEKKDELKGKEPGVIGSRSEGAALAVAAAVEVPDATANNAALGSRTIRKQKTWPESGVKPVSAHTKSPPPRVEEKKGWRRLFGNG
ncbi:unnamed protein product [Tuber melanosporum]|uniref:(Perigord truffle) hypothetical protein n=1 Tax=Tuber melanosporum (strain Mel28) TaxID=656061 RepID=D5GFA8_TUBMM|nr:uncharacterized protein GSTUM_00006804001 [Tuber melanosporum]CAZ83201.1 unnamed protein product [Tuber melanosporum]